MALNPAASEFPDFYGPGWVQDSEGHWESSDDPGVLLNLMGYPGGNTPPAGPPTPQAPTSPTQQAQTPQQPQPTSQQVKCSRATYVASGLGASAAINGLGALLTGGVTPVSWYFEVIGGVETVGAGAIGVYAAYVCFQQ
ncbi:MAG TPA: hypothetical protein VJP02_15370 [Candidatus Sulfotelmatobacter sp.]|nr:hypothetical protein [Candidatus Sulfotelmatobacter sp.]